jgi:GTP cyclohydrolase I
LNIEENKLDQAKVQNLISELIKEIGEDPKREGLLNTPKRVAKAYEFLTSGYHKKLKEVLNNAVFELWYWLKILIFTVCANIICCPSMVKFMWLIFPTAR